MFPADAGGESVCANRWLDARRPVRKRVERGLPWLALGLLEGSRIADSIRVVVAVVVVVVMIDGDGSFCPLLTHQPLISSRTSHRAALTTLLCF